MGGPTGRELLGGSRPDSERERDRQRAADKPWRGWYSLKRWRVLRLLVFQRDGYVCRRSGVLLVGKHPAANSPVANHIKPHRGVAALFWDPDNIETVSKAVHDSEIQKEEQAMPPGVWY